MATFADAFPYQPEPRPLQVPQELLVQFIRENPYALLVPSFADELDSSIHGTQLIAAIDGGVLYGYIERKNPLNYSGSISDSISDSLNGGSVRLVFPGPRAHLFLPTDKGTVPLRLQMTAIASGSSQLVTSIEEKVFIISEIQKLEGYEAQGGIDPTFLSGIVGFRMPINDLTGNFELGQKKNLGSIVDALTQRGRPDDLALARYAKLLYMDR